MKSLVIVTVALACVLTSSGPAATQTPGLSSLDTVTDTLQRVSPRSAFIRSLIVPGWGQASVGVYGRGGVYFGIQSASWYMLTRTLGRLAEARSIESRRVAAASDSLRQLMAMDTAAASRLSDPVAFADAVAADDGVAGSRRLIESREQQRQDWITYTIFFTMLSGLDAYVSAHLRDWPGDVLVEPRSGGGFDLGLVLPAGKER